MLWHHRFLPKSIEHNISYFFLTVSDTLTVPRWRTRQRIWHLERSNVDSTFELMTLLVTIVLLCFILFKLFGLPLAFYSMCKNTII